MVKRIELTQFQKIVYAACRKIPRGKVSTYGRIAEMIRRPGGARAVGNALNKNPFAPEVPCHRVVRSDGTVGGFASGGRKKTEMLKKEGIKISGRKVLNLESVIFNFKNI